MKLAKLLALLVLLTGAMARSEECAVQTREVVRAVYGSGYVRSDLYLSVRSSVSGYVRKVFVDRGDRVKKGQTLALIDSGGLRERIGAIEKKIKLLQDRLKKDSDFMKSLEHGISIKRENLDKAERRYRRRLRLYERGVIPKEALEEAERLYRLAKEDLRIAELSLRDRIRELETELSYLEKERDSLRRELSNYTIRSPIDGIVLKRFVEEGDYVNPMSRENTLLSLGSLKKKVVLMVDEEFAPLVRKGQKVYITTDAVPGRVFEGTVERFDLESEPSRRVVEVEVAVDLPESVPVNSVVEGNIVVSRLKTTVVPLGAVKDGFAVLLVDGERRKVKVNRVFERYAEVIGYPPGTPCLVQE